MSKQCRPLLYCATCGGALASIAKLTHPQHNHQIVKSAAVAVLETQGQAYYSEAMDLALSPNYTPGLFLRRLWSYFSLERIVFLFDLYQKIRERLAHRDREGLYEILEYDSTLELLDPQGKTATFKKHQRVRFIQDFTIAFEDYVWGDGQIFDDYACSPGVVVDRYQEGDRHNVLISLRETKRRGEIEDFYIQRVAKNGFTKAEEWWQVEIRHPTRRLKLSAIFPPKRRCRRAALLRRSQHTATVLGPEHFTDLPDSRQLLTWETGKIRDFEIFTLKWRW